MLKKPLVADDYAHTYAPFIQAAVREVGHNYRQAAKWLTRERSYRRLTGYGLSAVLTAFPFCSVILGWPMSCPPDVQGCLCLAALHRPGQWLFRVASHQRRRSKATLCRRNEERLTLRPSRTVRTGVTRTQVSGSAPLPGSRCPRTSWWVKIHDRMPAILEPASYDRWLNLEPDPHNLLISYPSEAMTQCGRSPRA